MQSIYKLRCVVQKYAWGNPNPTSVIAELTGEKEGPFAELWMGAHPSGSSILESGESLRSAIQRDPTHFLGERLVEMGHTELPYLFKILDAAKPLSIQAHPDKKLAEELHKKDPKNYPDNNHKPELAICLENMTALIGFRDPEEIKGFFESYPALARLCNYEKSDSDFVKACYKKLMLSDAADVQGVVENILENQVGSVYSPEVNLLNRLCLEFGKGDPGLLCIFFLNYTDVSTGEGLFLGPNEPHAYLQGVILECMAASDNVVRAGLTPKFVDKDVLLSMLHYRTGKHTPVKPTAQDTLYTYSVPTDEFVVHQLILNERKVIFPTVGGPTIGLVFEGQCEMWINSVKTSLTRGTVFFLPGDLGDKGHVCEIQGTGKIFFAHPQA